MGLVLSALLAAPGVAAAAALLAMAEGTHEVIVTAGDQGVEVLLHHSFAGRFHHHGPVARALTTFAAPSGQEQADHLLRFTTCSIASPNAPSAARDSGCPKTPLPGTGRFICSADAPDVICPPAPRFESGSGPARPRSPVLRI